MGKRGPAPAPTALKLVKGERRSRINENEPKPSTRSTPPACPQWLRPEARRVWKRLAPDLRRRGVLTEWDREAFAVYCEAVVHHRQACEILDASAVIIRGAQGNLVKNPLLQVIRDQAAIIRAFSQEFGLTPSARSTIKVGEGGPDGEELFDL